MQTRRIAFAVGVFLLCLILSEAVLRWVYPASQRVRYVPDPAVGYRLEPNQEVFVTNRAHEYESIFVTNSAGFRGEERAIEKPAGVYRIAVLGDSMVEAMQVPYEQTFTAILEDRLRESRDGYPGIRNVEVLNFGVSAYGTTQEWALYRSEVRKYRPDLVLVTFFASNDIRNNSYRLEVDQSERDPVAPFYSLTEGELERLDTDFYVVARAKFAELSQEKPSFVSRVRLLSLARDAHRAFRQMTSNDDGRSESGQLEVSRALYDPIVQQNSEPWKAAWRITGALFERFRKDVEADDAAFHVVVLPDPCAVGDACKYWLQRGAEGRTFDWLMPNRRTNQMLHESDVPFTNLTDAFLAGAWEDEGLLYFPNDGHFTAAGHQAVAGQITPIVQSYMARVSETNARRPLSE